MEFRKMVTITLYAKQKKRHRCIEQTFGLCGRMRGWDDFNRTASKHVYYLGWNRSPAQVGCMRQVLGPGALGRPRGIGWRGRWEGGSKWGIHVYPWLIHVYVWQKPLQYCKVISLQLIIKKKDVVYVYTHTRMYTHTGILLSHQKGQNLAICNTDIPGGCYTKWNKSDKEKHYMI